MQYKRTFRFAASHFNNLWAYELIWALRSYGGAMAEMCPKERLFQLLADIHGHNFVVVITIQSRGLPRTQDWLIDDIALEKIVMEWSNTNLSVHDDFLIPRERATTERMAEVLFDKLQKKFEDLIYQVEIHETSDIIASKGFKS